MGIIIAILIFSFIIFFHELGHFVLAKLNGIEVQEFAIGMGPALFAKEYHGTLYAVRIFPIGGYCAMGEDDEATDSPANFNNKSVWARISVIAAGPVFNFILAFVCAIVLIAFVGYDEPVIGSLDEGYPAQEAGLQPGDRIVEINGKNIHLFREVKTYNQFHQGEEVEIIFERDGIERGVILQPKYNEEISYYLLGINGAGNTRATPLKTLQYSAYEVKYWIDTTLSSLKMLVTGQIGIDQLSGPVGIVDVVDSTYKETRDYGALTVTVNMLNIAILISANLGVMNLLPLPALDGGRLVFLAIEAVRRKRISPEKEGYVHFAGIVVLMVLMVVVLFNDIQRVFF